MIQTKMTTNYILARGDKFYCGEWDFEPRDLLIDDGIRGCSMWTDNPRFATQSIDRVVNAVKERMSKYIDGLKVKKFTLMVTAFVEDIEENE